MLSEKRHYCVTREYTVAQSRKMKRLFIFIVHVFTASIALYSHRRDVDVHSFFQ